MDGFNSAPRVIIVEATSSTSPEAPVNSPNGAPPGPSWIWTEVAWGVGMFFRIALSVAVSRALAKAFHFGFAHPVAFEKAKELGEMGPVKKAFTPPGGPFSGMFRSSSSTSASSGPTINVAPGASSSEPRKEPKFVATVEGYDLFLVDKIEGQRQFWPCPIRYRSPCEGCVFCVDDLAGEPHCAMRVKLSDILSNRDDGATLYSIRQAIKKYRPK